MSVRNLLDNWSPWRLRKRIDGVKQLAGTVADCVLKENARLKEENSRLKAEIAILEAEEAEDDFDEDDWDDDEDYLDDEDYDEYYWDDDDECEWCGSPHFPCKRKSEGDA